MIASQLCTISLDLGLNPLSFSSSAAADSILSHDNEIAHQIHIQLRRLFVKKFSYFHPSIVLGTKSLQAQTWWRDSNSCRVFMNEEDRS